MKNKESQLIDLNFKGYANSVQNTDIILPPPKGLPNPPRVDFSKNTNYQLEIQNNKKDPILKNLTDPKPY